ncbi:MAG: inorganic phosphate transporter, partial [Candidatus Omnitrophica bacterium]|nr:inorganic phosphate transporter [Candidatus Omnitrophota bacterium]
MVFLIVVLAIFFALNMGASSFAASFAAGYGGKVISRSSARLYFLFFVVVGAVVLGKNVSLTLREDLIPPEFIVQKALIIIFLSSGLSMFVANIMKIPQTTSIVSVAAIAGVGAFFGVLNMQTIYLFIPYWIILPILCYGLTYFLTGLIYPPRKTNFWIYQKFINHQDKLKAFVIITSCYNAFSVGTNNVANVVGPLLAATNIPIISLLIIFAVFYGLGAFVFSGPIKTAGNKIVPLGLLTASMISLVSGTLMLIASIVGIPQSFVMLKMGALFAISTLKDGGDF